jgi:hypothetical protein
MEIIEGGGAIVVIAGWMEIMVPSETLTPGATVGAMEAGVMVGEMREDATIGQMEQGAMIIGRMAQGASQTGMIRDVPQAE